MCSTGVVALRYALGFRNVIINTFISREHRDFRSSHPSYISDYLDFGFYDKVWWKGNAGLSGFEPGRLLDISHRTSRLTCYYVLTQRGTVVSRSTVQRVTTIKKTTAEVKETFRNFNHVIQEKMKNCHEDNYIGDKPNPEHWADL